MKRALLTILFVFSFLTPRAVVSQTPTDEAALLQILSTEPDAERRADAVAQLAESGSDAVRRALEDIAGNEDEPASLRMGAICALAGSATGDSVPLLLSILSRDVEERRGFWACAIPVLGMVGDRRAVPLLRDIAGLDEDDLIGMDHMAISAIAAMATDEDVAFLESKAHVFAVRRDVIEALARLRAASSLDILISGLADGEEPEVVEAATEAVIKMGTAALPGLRAVLENHPDDVLKARVTALIDVLD